MTNRLLSFCVVQALLVGTAVGQDARSVLQSAAEAIGATQLKSIRYSGTGWRGAVGQSFRPDLDWPRFDMPRYIRTIDFETRSSKEEMVLVQGNNPPRGGGGTPIEGERHQTLLVSGDYAWNLQGDAVVPAPTAAEVRQLEIWLTPHGFLKAAMAGNPTAITRNEYGERVTVVSFTALGKYQVNGTITSDHLVARVQTWVPNPVVGDMYYENVYTDYRDFGGVKLPTFHQHQDIDDNERLPNVSGGDHAFGLNVTDVEVNVDDAALDVPAAVREAIVPPVRVESQRLADGVWYLGGSSHNSLAVEFRDYTVVVEAPLDEERSLAVIDEVARLMPEKPIRFLVTTHHHWDHIGGLRAYIHDGATVIAHEGNRAYYEELVVARRWIQKPDRLSLYPPEEIAEGYTFETFREKYVVSDGTRNLELHRIQGLNHSAGMVIAYLPKEKIVVEADLYSPSRDRPPATPNRSNRTFYDNMKRLKLDVETIVPVHGPVVPMSDFVSFMGESQESSGAR
ncbi:MAG TPA: MBL fold metallo-hydrolase [Vicinamibacteria bacterium]|nr:MBL fold metallo-hydrolase [Vicinamibacteria bacterium]